MALTRYATLPTGGTYTATLYCGNAVAASGLAAAETPAGSGEFAVAVTVQPLTAYRLKYLAGTTPVGVDYFATDAAGNALDQGGKPAVALAAADVSGNLPATGDWATATQVSTLAGSVAVIRTRTDALPSSTAGSVGGVAVVGSDGKVAASGNWTVAGDLSGLLTKTAFDTALAGVGTLTGQQALAASLAVVRAKTDQIDPTLTPPSAGAVAAATRDLLNADTTPGGLHADALAARTAAESAAGQTTDPGAFALTHTVLSASAQPIENATVRFAQAGVTRGRALTNAQGVAVVAVLAGTYTRTVTAPGFDGVTGLVVVTQDATLAVTLPPLLPTGAPTHAAPGLAN